MKTRKHLLTLLLVMAPLFAFSQSSSLAMNKFGDNWFISIGGGVQALVGEGYNEDGGTFKSIGDNISPAVTLSVGKMFTPVIGLRIQATGWEVKDNYSWGDNKLTYVGGHGDVLINLNNLFGSYNPNRFFEIIPFAGAGFYYKFGNDDKRGTVLNVYNNNDTQVKSRNFSINGGILTRFRLTDALDLNLELQGAILPDKFNNIVLARDYDGLASVTLGLTYKFGNNTFEACSGADDALIAQLNSQINTLRNDLNACLANRPVDRQCPDCPKCPDAKDPVVVTGDCPSAVGVVKFALGSAKVSADQQINVYNAADYLKNNPGINLKVVGYADKKTGNASINMRLSEQRAKAVTKMLVDKYGISQNRIETSWDGDTVQPYSNNEWNRVVIFVPQGK